MLNKLFNKQGKNYFNINLYKNTLKHIYHEKALDKSREKVFYLGG